ncbi:hypothetical protein BLJ79_16345 [Arthrobacter sp. UCD-GKA]|uniref:hypothetical protein n=1 Tax=Arthrobacter sp. UCD-GKA TaxID=1913576 RepID=UPI0008DE71B8|nr:hypothetical protein [Arthrobacter sp. UCD-GKA]OIH83161.1 hypothetical protein BLJ79_16345 [Arthrobacter sp. UCD-GKA]
MLARNTTWMVLPLVLGLGLATAGCGQLGAQPLKKNVVVGSELSLDGSIAAIYLSRQAREFRESGPNGYLVLVDGQGEIKALETSGMDNAQTDWSEHGLVFADTANDYHLQDGLHTTPSVKTDYQQAMSGSGAGSSLGLYNDGFNETGYTEQAVGTSPDGAVLHDVEGYYQVTGFCDGTLFGLAEPSGAYAREAGLSGHESVGTYAFRSLMLSRLSGTPSGAERVIGIRTVDESSQDATDAPCVEGRLHHLASTYDAGGTATPVIRSWDVETATFTQHEIVLSPEAQALENGDYGFEMHGYSRDSVRESNLDWVAVDGRVMSTNLETGRTKVLFAVAADDYDVASSQRSVEFTPTSLAVVTSSQDGKAVSFVQYDRYTGEELRRFDLPDVAKALNTGLVLTDLAVRPD